MGRKTTLQNRIPAQLPSKKQEEKYRDVVKWFRKGKTQEQVYEELENKYNIKRATAMSLVKQTLGWINRSTAEKAGGYILENARCMQQIRLEDVYNRCIEARDYREAINALKELNKILGLYKDIQVTNNNTVVNAGNTPTTISFRFGTGDSELYIEPGQNEPRMENNVEVIGPEDEQSDIPGL